MGQLLEQLSPYPLLSGLTWIQGGSSLWQQAEVHLAKVNGVVEGREKHPPESHYSSHQHVDGEEKKGGNAEHAPGGREETGRVLCQAGVMPPCPQALLLSSR